MLYEYLFPPTAYHWLVLGLLLLIAEALGAAGFLLGGAIAALLLGALLLVTDLHWHVQLGAFAVLTVLSTWIYWARFRRFNERQADHALLNDRAAQLIGRRFVLDAPIRNGSGKLKVGDTLWSVAADGDVAASESVEVVGTEGMTLRVRKLS